MKKIKFITPVYEELFSVNDGESVRLVDEYGNEQIICCSYVDEYHFMEDGKWTWHICEFAERNENEGYVVSPVRREDELSNDN